MPPDGPGSEFESAESYYADYRPDYDARAIDHLVARFDLAGDARVLDLGCGAGQVALAVAPHVGEVVGMDPNESMLRHARRRAEREGRTNTTWVAGSDADLGGEMGPFQLVAVGRAFHRMDRERVLSVLPDLLAPDGGLALLGDTEWLTRGTAAWQDAVHEVVAARLDDLPERTGPVEYDEPYDELLARAGYRDVESVRFERERTWTVDEVVGYVLSLSFSAPRRFADPSAFERDLRTRLGAFDPPLVEHARTTVVSGRPPR